MVYLCVFIVTMQTVSAEKFLKQSDILPVVDVRSPAEFAQGHIPGALNIPLFDNEERKEVGIRYKQSGKEDAVLLGLDIVGPKMSSFVKKAKRISKNKELLVHCWRGGMRSGSMAWLFETAGLKPYVLEGGYKAYRRYIRARFSVNARLIVLGGYTGSGKTDILKALQAKGEQFLDIEGTAHHKGSVFGPLGQKQQPTNEQFENNLAHLWRKFDFSKPVWIEDESRQLGKVGIPDPLFLKMREAPVVVIEVAKPVRVRRLVKEYGSFDKELLAQQLEKIRERLGGQWLKDALSALEKGDMERVAEIALNYYDKAYGYGIKKRDTSKVFFLPLRKDDPEANADILFDFVNRLKLR